MYEYAISSVKRIVDGDTIWAYIDCGFYVTVLADLRLARINCPEMSTSGGQPAKDFTTAWVANRSLRIITAKADSWKRWIAEVFDANTNENLSDTLLVLGLAVPYKAG